MQEPSSSIPSDGLQGRGGRFSSPQHRQAQRFCDDFTGLETGVKRYDLLLLVKRAGKAASFTPRMIELLDYYMAYTRDIDWEEGSRPIVYQSLTRTALDLGVSERQIQKLEKQLFDQGAITWNDSGNRRRYGVRDKATGKLLYAYGVDLAPLAGLKSALQDKLHAKQRYEKAWLETKRQISAYRGQIRAMLGEAWQLAEADRGGIEGETLTEYEERAEALAKPIRTYMTLDALRGLLADHRALYTELKAILIQDEPQATLQPLSYEPAPTDDQNFAHKEDTNQEPSNKLDHRNHSILNEKLPVGQRQRPRQNPPERSGDNRPETGQEGRKEACREPNAGTVTHPRPAATDRKQTAKPPCGLEHLNWKQIIQAASDRFMDSLVRQTAGMQRPVLAGDCVRAAYDLSRTLGIRHDVWVEACTALGEQAAAVCVILIDHAMHRPDNTVQKPSGYFRAMIDRAARGELHLHRTVFGILKAGRGDIHA